MTTKIINRRKDGKLLVSYHFTNGVTIKKIISVEKYQEEIKREGNK